MRMNSESFQNFITKIRTHSIFQSAGNRQQAPIELITTGYFLTSSGFKR